MSPFGQSQPEAKGQGSLGESRLESRFPRAQSGQRTGVETEGAAKMLLGVTGTEHWFILDTFLSEGYVRETS